MRKSLTVLAVLAIVLGILLPAGTACAAEPAAAMPGPQKEYPNFTFGGDIRLREVYFDEIPIKADPPGITRGGANHFFRFRTRLWGQADLSEQFAVRGRLVNEFREYIKPEDDGTGRNTWNAMDEVVVDQLYVDAKDLFDGNLDLRIGRQDLIYGTGKLLLEGTPKDGSRTIYMDAVKLTYKGIEDQLVDVFGIYNTPENELAFHSEDRDLTGQTKYYDDITESGGGVYWKCNASEMYPGEFYYIYKNESDWERITAAGPVPVDELDLHTVGTRMMPKLENGLSGNFEFAYQTGDRGTQDVEAFGMDLLVNYALSVSNESLKPKLGLGWYYLSGDDPSTTRDEGWNPLWARWPQYSELYIYAYDADGAGRWSNLSMPHLDLTIVPASWIKTTAMAGYMWAPEKDGPGDGDGRGFLFVLRNDLTLGSKLLSDKDKLSGHLWLELLEPGDYYNEDDLAVFARWELSYAF